MTTTRDRIVAAAIELLGTEGLRSLTHRRVDERAGLPAGSTSNHFRTRAALLEGAVDGITREELGELRDVPLPDDAAGLVEMVAGLVELVTGPQRVATTARHVLFIEASRDPALRERLSAARGGYVDAVRAVLERLGAAEPVVAAEALMAVSEGLILHRIARHDASDPRAAIAVAVQGALA
ncbi:TetR/AcrR family transcriptional regulator [Agrococcus sp. HG114]|uniref:TetR/AcrR family transcriptional regulator n=1 Tax=Agrococcus sp. HG114 TaxID=2969757 RepID=UPI00215A8406|nr:TetR family transcriptional regulator [Agrococcus sp. HG114]MCR8670292.1 TetR family transcriptional regulator [Agrococcus sp. HG114]